jgi:hypothetical protein
VEALYRCYFARAPAIGVGMDPADEIVSIAAQTMPPRADWTTVTLGVVHARSGAYDYALTWSLRAGKPTIEELTPGDATPGGVARRGPAQTLAQRRLFELAPAPVIRLDPVAEAIWEHEHTSNGLPFAIRCLAAWWRIEPSVEPEHPPTVLAAAVSRGVGAGRSLAHTAKRYAAAPLALREAERILEPLLRGRRRPCGT